MVDIVRTNQHSSYLCSNERNKLSRACYSPPFFSSSFASSPTGWTLSLLVLHPIFTPALPCSLPFSLSLLYPQSNANAHSRYSRHSLHVVIRDYDRLIVNDFLVDIESRNEGRTLGKAADTSTGKDELEQ